MTIQERERIDAIREATTDATKAAAIIAAFDLIAPERRPFILSLMEGAGCCTDFIEEGALARSYLRTAAHEEEQTIF